MKTHIWAEVKLSAILAIQRRADVMWANQFCYKAKGERKTDPRGARPHQIQNSTSRVVQGFRFRSSFVALLQAAISLDPHSSWRPDPRCPPDLGPLKNAAKFDPWCSGSRFWLRSRRPGVQIHIPDILQSFLAPGSLF
jgi:hypothetical protein